MDDNKAYNIPAPDVDTEPRRRLLFLWEKLADQLSRLFLRHHVLVPELEDILRWRATRLAVNDPEFAVEGRSERYRQSDVRASIITGLRRQDVAGIAESDSPVSPDGGDLHRLIRILTAWRTEEGYQYPTGHPRAGEPIDLPVRGPAPSLHQLSLKYGRSVTARAIADALIVNGNAEWVGEGERMRSGKMIRFLSGVITADDHELKNMAIFAQIGSDFMNSYQKMMSAKVKQRPRFREGYFNDIDAEKFDEAIEELHDRIQVFNAECVNALGKYRSSSGKNTIRLGVGSYSFFDSPLILDELDNGKQNQRH